MRTFPFIAGLVVAVLLGARPGLADFPPEPGGYDDEGGFVVAPAAASGMMLGLAFAPIGYLICAPIDLACRAGGRTERVGTVMDTCGVGAFQVGYYGAYYVVGTPFHVLKKTFWDWPELLLGIGHRGDARDNETAASRDAFR